MTRKKRVAHAQWLRLLVCCLLLLLFSAEASAQEKTADLLDSPGILRNGIASLHAQGDSLWVGPKLNLTTDGGQTWQVADADSLTGSRNSIYSLDVEGQTIWAGLGNSVRRNINGEITDVNQAAGVVFSEDGGQTWTYRTFFPPTDRDPQTTGLLDLPEDSLITYGETILRSLPITTPDNAPPWDIDYDPATGTVWTASQLGGIRRSADKGLTWERVVLPPDTTEFLSPELGLDFPFFVLPVELLGQTFEGLNFQTFAVMVDEEGVVWAGSVGGLNRSEDGGVSWRHFRNDGPLSAFAGNWVVSIEEQPLPGRNPVWATNWPGVGENEGFGLVVTRDGGETFEQTLRNKRLYDLAFRGETVYAASDGGLFISDDGGINWRTARDFFDPTQPERTVRPDVQVFSVATTNDALWIGTSDGLFRSTDEGQTWTLFRADVPLSPDDINPAIISPGAVPRVDAYAYPNPFSPATDQLVRIRYDLDQQAQVHVRVFDFGMNLVRDLREESQAGGKREVAWDGTDDDGARVANGVYFYAIEADGKTTWGKILVLE